MRKSFLWIFGLASAMAAEAAELSASGGWTRTITASDLTGGAGSDLAGTYQSLSGQTTLDVTKAKNQNWTVTARLASGTWNGNLKLYIRRTSNGTGPGTVNGGTTYIELTGVDQVLFTGTDNKNNIQLQYQLSGMSVRVLPNIYSSSVVFTITP